MADVLDRMQQEIGDRLSELRPAVEEYERLQAAVEALGGAPAESTPSPRKRAGGAQRAQRVPRKGKRARSGAAQRGILAALGHGSHSVKELVTVTAMSDANIRGNLSRLMKEGAVSKTKRGDGKSAYALSSQAVAA